MSEYGKQGKEYILGGHSISVNQEFLLATIMAVVVAVKELSHQEQFDNIVEGIAEQIYDQLTKAEHGTTEERTDEPRE